jgi:hypothetical protein
VASRLFPTVDTVCRPTASRNDCRRPKHPEPNTGYYFTAVGGDAVEVEGYSDDFNRLERKKEAGSAGDIEIEGNA